MGLNSNEKLFLLLLSIWIVFSVGNATAEAVIVDCNGNGNHTSIQKAIDDASPGDSIVVLPGTYTENLLVNKSVSIVSESGNPDDTTILSADECDDVIHVTANNVAICGFNITRVDQSYIENEYPDYYYSGIFLDNVRDCLVIKNKFSYNYVGIFLDCSLDNTISNNSAFLNGGGISLSSSNENIVTHNNAFSDVTGIHLSMSYDNKLLSNNIESCTNNGVSFSDSLNTTVAENNIKNCDNGIRIGFGSYNSTLANNTVTLNNCSFYLYYSDHLTISDNIVSGNNKYGFYMRDSYHNEIKNNIISNNSEYGMYLQYSSNYNLIYNNFFNNTNNVRDECLNTWNATRITGANIVGGSYLGGNFWARPDGTGFSQTHEDTDKDGICDEIYAIEGSNADKLPLSSFQDEDIIVDGSGCGDHTSIQAAVDAAAEGTTIVIRNGTYIENINVGKSVTIISESRNPLDVIIRPFDVEKNLITINADNVTLGGLTVTGANSSKAISLYESTNCLINNTIVESNEYGIYLNNSDSNKVINNTLKSNDLIGLCLFESDNNTISFTSSLNDFIGFDLVRSSNNNISQNVIEDDRAYGIYLHELSHDNIIFNNTIDHTYSFEPSGSTILSSESMYPVSQEAAKEFDLYTVEYFEQGPVPDISAEDTSLSSTVTDESGVASGIGLFLNKHNTGNLITGNIVENSLIYGLCLGESSSGNTIYDNYFNNGGNFFQNFNNTNKWNVTKKSGSNIIDGPYLGGNYWVNPSGTGFSQTHPDMDGDGICDDVYSIDGSNIDSLPLCLYENSTHDPCLQSIIHSGLNLSDIIDNHGIEVFDTNSGSMVKCLEFNSSNFGGFLTDYESNASTEILRIYDDADLVDCTIPEGSLEYKSTIYMEDFNATFDDYPYEGYNVLNLFGEQYVSLGTDSPNMFTKLILNSNDVITLSPGESIDLGEGFTFRFNQFDTTGEKVWVDLHRYDEFIDDEVLTLTEPNGTTWWYDFDIASEDDVVVFGVHVLKNNSSSITIDGVWLTDFQHILLMECGDRFGNLEVTNIDSNSLSMRNYAPMHLERDTIVGIVNDLSFEILDKDNFNFRLVKGLQNEFASNTAPISMIYYPQPNLFFKGDLIYFEGSGFDFDDMLSAYKWTSSIDGHLSDLRTFSTRDLTAGNHTINFSVQDDSGSWSEEVSTSLVVGDTNITVNTTFESQFGGPVEDVAIFGNYSCVAQGQNVIVVDISTPSDPVEVSRFPTSSTVEEIEGSGDYVYVADDDLLIVNVSNPKSPIVESSYIINRSIEDICISDNYAYVASYGGLEIIDVSDPALPTMVGSYTGLTYDVSVNETHAYVLKEFKDEFSIINISNPTSLAIEGSCDFSYHAQENYVSGDYSYVAAGDDGLIIVNISNPMSPEIVGICDTIYDASDVFVIDNYAYVADGRNGLITIDVGDPAKPTLVSSYESLYSSGLLSIDISGNYAYSADKNYGFVVFDIGNPISPEFAGKCDTVVNLWNVGAYGDYAYTTTGADGFVVIDISDSTYPKIADSSYSGVSGYNHFAISNEYVYVADGPEYVSVIDISNPFNTTYAGRLETRGTAYDIAVSDKYAYVVASSGLLVFDISNPLTSKLIGSYETASSARRISVSNNYAYLTVITGELLLIDISDPVTPMLVGSCDVGGGCSEIAAYEGHVYLASYYNGLVTVDATDPTNPFLLHSSSSLRAEDVVVSDGNLYVASPGKGLVIVDIKDPKSPSIIGNYYIGSASGVDVLDNLVCLAGYRSGLVILQTELMFDSVNFDSPAIPVSTSSSSSGGGGGGSGTTGETYENIAFKDVKTELVLKDSVTSYDFTDENNEVEFVRFVASRNWGKISSTVECLHEVSALVDKEPDGIVYHNVNIWVGKSGFSDSDNIRDCAIGFRVSRSWIEEKGVDKNTIRLLHYSSGEWEELETSLVDEDEEYLHFEAKTSGFSPFAIVAYPSEEITEDTDKQMSLNTAPVQEVPSADNATKSQSPSAPGFKGIMGILSLFLAGYYIVQRKRN